MLVVNGLCYERNKRVLFHHLAFQLYPGQILYVSGPNGAGKTSLLQILAGLVSPTKGDILWHGVSIAQDALPFKENLLYISHRLGVKSMLTPIENLCLLLARRDWQVGEDLDKQIKQKTRDSIEQVLTRLDLTSCSYRLTSQLSAGQQRRLALAKLLLIKADCWILDEPFTALDEAGVILISSLIDAQRYQGGIIILTSHQTGYLSQIDVKKISLGGECV